MYELMEEHLMKCFGTKVTEEDLLVLAKSFGFGELDEGGCVASTSELVGFIGRALVRRRAWGAQVPDNQATARISQI